MQHVLNHIPGQHGKGFVLQDGTIHTWPIGEQYDRGDPGGPHHAPYAAQNGHLFLDSDGGYVGPQGCFHINPSGEFGFTDYSTMPERIKPLNQYVHQATGLTPAGEQPVGNWYAWADGNPAVDNMSFSKVAAAKPVCHSCGDSEDVQLRGDPALWWCNFCKEPVAPDCPSCGDNKDVGKEPDGDGDYYCRYCGDYFQPSARGPAAPRPAPKPIAEPTTPPEPGEQMAWDLDRVTPGAPGSLPRVQYHTEGPCVSGGGHPMGAPVIYDGDTDTVHVGQDGDYHWDVIENAGLGHKYENYAMNGPPMFDANAMHHGRFAYKEDEVGGPEDNELTWYRKGNGNNDELYNRIHQALGVAPYAEQPQASWGNDLSGVSDMTFSKVREKFPTLNDDES